MKSEFKTELKKLIDEAADKHTNGFDTTDFKAGCDFLMPLIEELMKQRDLEFPVDDSWSGKRFATDLKHYNEDSSTISCQLDFDSP